jgi:hypothetical protein
LKPRVQQTFIPNKQGLQKQLNATLKKSTMSNCPQLPHDIIFDIIRQADGGRTAHSKKFKPCLEEMLDKYTVDVQIWGSIDDPSRQFDLKMWITEARGIDCSVDGQFRCPNTGDWCLGCEGIYNANIEDSERAENWKEDFWEGHTSTFNYPAHTDHIWGVYSYVYQ